MRTRTVAVLLAGLFASVIAGASEPSDMDGSKTTNGKIAVDYLTMRFNAGKMAAADKLYESPNVVEHGYLGMARGPNAAAEPAPTGQPPKITMDVKKVIVQGDLVFIQALGRRGEQGNGDLMWILYRIKDGKVVEHWDTHNPIPDDQVGKQW